MECFNYYLCCIFPLRTYTFSFSRLKSYGYFLIVQLFLYLIFKLADLPHTHSTTAAIVSPQPYA